MSVNIPAHVAIIMDGNGRWAKEHHLSRNEGHKRGSETLKTIIRYGEKIGIKYITVYAFSTENWNRPKDEVDGLMKLLKKYLADSIKVAKKENIKFKIIGDTEKLDKAFQTQIEKLEAISEDHTGLQVNIAMNYGGKDEITRAVKQIGHKIKEGTLELEGITEELISTYLDTGGIPNPDLMIRTSGEIRTSNFLPWQLAYSEFYFTPCLWPEFTEAEFDKALDEYSRRKRRFGKSE